MLKTKIADFFSPNGALAAHIPNFRSRPQQVEMAEAIAEAIAANGLLIAEAGTGTGKTFAYLVPALLAGGKVVISTGTKNLQDQLFQRDLPMVRDALKAPVSIALLKGRANYVCHYHLERAQSDGRLPTREDVRHLARIVKYAKITQTGDKGGLADVPETASIWMHVTSTRDNCLGQECPSHKDCFVLKARKEAMTADVVVVNHHLFFADVMLRDEGVAELLPACNTVIFDEAHQLPETASLFFGENMLLEKQAERSEGLENCWNRGLELARKISQWKDNTQLDMVRWVEIFNHSVQLNTTPLSIAEIFAKQIGATPRAWIFTSATLAVKRDFSHYQGEMGLITAKTACWDSPFNYPEQALLYSPENMPDPNSPGYTEAVIAAALPLIIASKGRAFLLFTSLRAMQRAHEILLAEFDLKNLKYPLMLQGEGSRNELLSRFREHGNAVLLGSQSFWEGVDVRGEALSLVVIDKLPFAPPDDPVLAARIAQITKQGRNAFMEYQLPRAVINLKQGAGRLIRDESDHGVLMICDPRLIGKPYGKRIWQSLPPFKRTRVLSEAVAFFDAKVVAEV